MPAASSFRRDLINVLYATGAATSFITYGSFEDRSETTLRLPFFFFFTGACALNFVSVEDEDPQEESAVSPRKGDSRERERERPRSSRPSSSSREGERGRSGELRISSGRPILKKRGGKK